MTTHKLYQRHAPALGIDSYNTFCRLLELLDAPADFELFDDYGRGWQRAQSRKRIVGEHKARPMFEEEDEANFRACTLAEVLAHCIEVMQYRDERVRAVLLDGTVIREWPIDEYDGIF